MAGKYKSKKPKMSLMERHRQARLMEMALSNNAGTNRNDKDKNPKQLKRKFQHQNSNTSWNIEDGDVLDKPGKFVKNPRIESDLKMLESPKVHNQTTPNELFDSTHFPESDTLRETSPTDTKKNKGIEQHRLFEYLLFKYLFIEFYLNFRQ